MKKKRFTDEQIVRILRAAEATTIEAAARQHGVSEQSIYRWNRQFGTMEVDDARELRHLRQENGRLKKVLAERDLEVEVMKELQAKKNSGEPTGTTAGGSSGLCAWAQSTAGSLAIHGGAFWATVSVQTSETGCPAGLGPPSVTKRYTQWGYRLAGGFLRSRGWRVNLKRIHRGWKEGALPVPKRKPRKKIKTGVTLPTVAKTQHAVWSWDFVHDVTTDGHAFRCLTVKDEHTRWCLAIEVARSFTHERVIEGLTR